MTMDKILERAVEQAPALVILLALSALYAKSGALVVRSFLAQQSESRAEYLKAIERFHSENMEARNTSKETIHDNSQAAMKQTEALHELTAEVRELRSSLNTVIRQFGNR